MSTTQCDEWKRFRDAQGSPCAEQATGCANGRAGDWHSDALKPGAPTDGWYSIEMPQDAPSEGARTDEPGEDVLRDEKTKAQMKTCADAKTTLRHDGASASR